MGGSYNYYANYWAFLGDVLIGMSILAGKVTDSSSHVILKLLVGVGRNSLQNCHNLQPISLETLVSTCGYTQV